MVDPVVHAAVTRLIPLDLGRMDVPAQELVAGATGIVAMPFPAFLVDHPAGLVLFDTGLSCEAYDDPTTYFGPKAAELGTHFSPSLRIDRQLARHGIAPEDVAHVVLSHIHSDHAGGLHHFPDAQLHIGAGEFAWAREEVAAGNRFVQWDQQIAPVLHRSWHEVDDDHDLLGDGSVVLLRTPGHTPGHLSLVVRLPTRTILLTADATHLRCGLTALSPDPEDWDPAIAIDSLRRIQRYADQGAEVWIGHDPDDWVHFGAPGVLR